MVLQAMQQPLAYRIRPKTLTEVIGQDHLTGDNGLLKRFIKQERLFSMIFFGPPGTGKTTVATILANALNIPSETFNAVTGNKKDLDTIFASARLAGHLVLIVDEVHRLNKDKQDLLLPYVEDGHITLIGLTTSNPYFSINPAIRSRCILVEFKALSQDHMQQALRQALTHPDSLLSINCNDEILTSIVRLSNGDVRMAYNTLDVLNIAYPSTTITKDHLSDLNLSSNLNFDHDDDGYYDALSAFQKSIRGSHVDAALYYLARLLVAEDLDSIERRLLVTAYEDIGLANPALVSRTVQACDVARRVGFPECIYPLAVVVIDLALSPKSKAAALAIGSAIREVKEHPLAIPPFLRLTPVNTKDEDKYDYEGYNIWHKIDYLPKSTQNLPFYKPFKNSVYENTLENNLKTLNEIKRTQDIKSLKK